MPTALITGITGQDGSYLAELLLAKGYRVHGLVRQAALEDPAGRMWRILPFIDRLTLHAASLDERASVMGVLSRVGPDECYHLAAHSSIGHTFEDELATLRTNIGSTHHVLAAIKETCPGCRFYLAASSEVFGRAEESPQSELTRFHPRSAYGISKVAGFHLTRSYREAHGLFAVSGIAFNHESPRRGFEFVTRKITNGVAKIRLGRADKLELGNLDARRDWGHARDYVRAMWLMLRQDQPEDFVIATGRTHSVRDFCRLAFERVGLDAACHVESSERYFRSEEATQLVGDASKANRLLGWEASTDLETLVAEMVDSDLRLEQSRA